MKPLLKQWRFDHFKHTCRQHGLPLTVQRRAVFESILDREDHPTADQVYACVQAQIGGISRATVYRVLDAFVRLGLITRTCHPGSAARFDPEIHQHHHLVCMACEKIFDVNDERLNNIPRPDVRRRDFTITDYHIHFRGMCSSCRRQARTKTAKMPKKRKRKR